MRNNLQLNYKLRAKLGLLLLLNYCLEPRGGLLSDFLWQKTTAEGQISNYWKLLATVSWRTVRMWAAAPHPTKQVRMLLSVIIHHQTILHVNTVKIHKSTVSCAYDSRVNTQVWADCDLRATHSANQYAPQLPSCCCSFHSISSVFAGLFSLCAEFPDMKWRT